MTTITEEQKQIVKSTAPILKEHGKEITSIFYKKMFEAHPELRNYFNLTNQEIGTQPLALANTVYLAAENIEQLDVLLPQVKTIAHKHRSLTIKAEHYPIVGEYLLKGIAEYLGDAATPEILDAWGAAYGIIAEIFIEVEQEMYDALGDERNRDFIEFKIIKKENVAPNVFTLDLARNDGGELVAYEPGQYLSLRIKLKELFHNRQYSLTKAFDGESYQVAIKQENEKEPAGVVSNHIFENYHVGDTILATLPAGDFELDKAANNHVFIAGGIGITPIAAMVDSLEIGDQAQLIHCVRTEEYAVFAEEFQEKLGAQYHLFAGKNVTKADLEELVKLGVTIYLCGPVPFMREIETILLGLGHVQSAIHFEAFQPALSLVK
ncbi:globin domain-containing protein [Listeria cornellensis]|uniref:nitric oxide dioxygenase n=1 Tax=Listeria cornellensis FSL F6-0969 TaxID=1265820 RepID=W7CH26_9LIST|nr:globin domain-containing protein [Listeria cornellensis]EUJ32193.1 flavohemoprotein [Listeria cornellensis FSL F6-0969]